MTTTIVSASAVVKAAPAIIFEYIADPARQAEWDGNNNLAAADPGQRVHKVGDSFVMRLTNGASRLNRIVEFAEGRLIAWLPSPLDADPPGHLWRWELADLVDGTTRVTHTYDWTRLTDPARLAKAQATTHDHLMASITRLAALAEGARSQS